MKQEKREGQGAWKSTSCFLIVLGVWATWVYEFVKLIQIYT